MLMYNGLHQHENSTKQHESTKIARNFVLTCKNIDKLYGNKDLGYNPVFIG